MTVSALPRAHSFRDEIEAVIKASEPAELVDRLHELHVSAIRPMQDRIRNTSIEASRVHDDARNAAHRLLQAESLAAHVSQQVTRHAAVVAAQKEQLAQIRKLAQGSFDGKVNADDVSALLTSDVPLPTSQQIPLSFIPSAEYRGGMFMSPDRAVQIVFTFVGWTDVCRYIGGGIAVEPTFLLGDRGAVPQSVIEAERELRLEMPLLPHVRAI